MRWDLQRELTSQNKGKEAQKTTYGKALPSPQFAYTVQIQIKGLTEFYPESFLTGLLVSLEKWGEVNKSLIARKGKSPF